VLGEGHDTGTAQVDVQDGDVHPVILECTESLFQIRYSRRYGTTVRGE
jgi:hypothetical protein